MEVNKILRLSATMLQLSDIEEIFNNVNVIEDVDNEDLRLLLNCFNLVSNSIATDYINLTKSISVVNDTGLIEWSKIGDEQIYKVIKVKDSFGHKISFKITASGIVCEKGNVTVVYCYFPKEYTYNSIMNDFTNELTERIFAMGVVSEYLFIKGNSNDASIWEDRFKNAMKNVVRVRKEIILPKRRWW